MGEKKPMDRWILPAGSPVKVDPLRPAAEIGDDEEDAPGFYGLPASRLAAGRALRIFLLRRNSNIRFFLKTRESMELNILIPEQPHYPDYEEFPFPRRKFVGFLERIEGFDWQAAAASRPGPPPNRGVLRGSFLRRGAMISGCDISSGSRSRSEARRANRLPAALQDQAGSE